MCKHSNQELLKTTTMTISLHKKLISFSVLKHTHVDMWPNFSRWCHQIGKQWYEAPYQGTVAKEGKRFIIIIYIHYSNKIYSSSKFKAFESLKLRSFLRFHFNQLLKYQPKINHEQMPKNTFKNIPEERTCILQRDFSSYIQTLHVPSQRWSL